MYVYSQEKVGGKHKTEWIKCSGLRMCGGGGPFRQDGRNDDPGWHGVIHEDQ